jgi:hypothetical protein
MIGLAVAAAAVAALAQPGPSLGSVTAAVAQRYAQTATGPLVSARLDALAADPLLRNALRARDEGRRSADVYWLWFASPACRIRVLHGARILGETGVAFCGTPARRTLRDARGRYLGTLVVAFADMRGFVRDMHRRYGVELVARASARVTASLPAAARLRLPARGTVIVAGRRYRTRSFAVTAWDGARGRIWVLARAAS